MEYIDLRAYLKKLGKNWLIILLCCLIGGTAAFIYSKFMATPKYSSSIRISVYDSEWSPNSTNESRFVAAEKVIQTSMVLLKDDYAIEKIGETINEYASNLNDSNDPTNLRGKLASLTKRQLYSALSYSYESGTFIMNVSAKTTDPEISQFICNAVAAAAPAIIQEFIPSAQMKTIGGASYSASPVSPVISKNVTIGVVGSLAAVCILFFVILLFDNKIADEDSFKNKFKNITILGVIPNLDELKGGGYGRYGRYGRYGKNQ